MEDVLLIIDVQRALVDELTDARRSELFGTLVPLLEAARSTGRPVVYVRHDGSPDELVPQTAGWDIASEISPNRDEPIVDKRHGNAFEETNLADILSKMGAAHIIAAGMQTDYCVTETITGAVELGYCVTLVGDGHATYPSAGKSEEQIRDAMHADTIARGARIVSGAKLFPAES